MQLKKSLTAAQHADASTEDVISAYPTDSLPDPQINTRMVQNVLLIWLDENIDEHNADCRNTINQLRHVVNNINKFTDADKCIQYIENIDNEKTCMIISSSLGQYIVPLIHNMSQIDSIFIFCNDKEYHEQWIKEWSKIKGIFTEILAICQALKQAAQECEHNAISISIMATDDISKKSLDELEPSFMYMQIIKEILLSIEFESKHFNQYIEYCRDIFDENNHELQNIKKLEQQYREKTPIWWYTLESFLYPMVNRGLRQMDVDIIIKMGFFIKDLHQHIEQLHGQESNKQFVVYHGQGMSKIDFEQLTKTKGGLIAFNNFLSTSKDRSVSLRFANHALRNPDLVGVVFIMTVDSSQATTPFASIKDVSAIQSEDEVLFAMQTVFRIGNITSMDENARLFQVELSLTDDNDKDLRQLTAYIRKETWPDSEGWYRLGEVFRRMGRYEKSEEVYRILLEQTTNESEKAPIYNQLGLAKRSQGQYKEAIIFIEKDIDISRKTLPPNHPNLAKSYNNVGLVYDEMGEYTKALSYFEKAVEIQQLSLPPNHPNLAFSYNNIGMVYKSLGEYSKALSYYEKSLEILQQILPPNHPDLALSYNNIGLIYNSMGEYPKALSFLEKALEIQKQSLLPNHSDSSTSYNNIGIVYDNMGEYSKALSYYEKSLEILQQLFPSNHPHLVSPYGNIGIVYKNMGDYSKALSYFEKALEIQQQSLPSNHSDLAISYNNIGLMYDEMEEYSKALSYFEKALEIQQLSFPPNHIDLPSPYGNIGTVYRKMGEYSKALSYHEKALEIQAQALPPNHPDLAGSYGNIGLLYENMGNYSKAHSSFERAFQIVQQLPPATDLVVKRHQNDLERIKKKLYF